MLRVVMLCCVVVLFACGGDDDNTDGPFGGFGGSAAFGGGGGFGAVGGTGGSGGAGGAGDGGGVKDCPVAMPEDNTRCGEQGLLCFYDAATGALVQNCVACGDWPPCTRVTACNGQGFFNHIDRGSCDGGLSDADVLDSGREAGVEDAGVDADVLDGSTDATQPDASANCRPGRYVGSLTGTYTSPAFGNGETPLVLHSFDAPDGTSGLKLWLAPSTTPCAPGAAFCPDLVVMSGTAHLQFGDYFPPLSFDAAITGALDCETGEFRGDLTAPDDTFPLAFTGPMHAAYDASSSTFTQGTWSVTETPCPNGAHCGGQGTWTATWTDAPASSDDDAGVFGDAGATGDAGTDAGTLDCRGGGICRTSPLAMSYLPAGTGFCAPPGTANVPPACTTTDAACGPSGGTCLAFGVCLKSCTL